MTRILVLDDDKGVVDYLSESLTELGYDVVGMTSPADAIARVSAESFDLLLTDIEMPQMRGLDLLRAVHQAKPRQLVMLMTAFGSIELAVQAVRAGACDFIAKPFRIEVLHQSIERALRERNMMREIVRLRASATVDSPEGLVARSTAMQKVLDTARRAALVDATVLITGETGTGKTALARFIHASSERREAPFVDVNCSALPETLIEAELFGAKRGAFTDARESRPGLFLKAGGGTILLDEVGELPLALQPKLLHVLESSTLRPVGSDDSEPFRARVLAATNRSLEGSLRDGRFRPDLYYRLNVLRIEVPPLRARRDDIVALVDHFLSRASSRFGREVIGVSASAMRRLMAHDWPGNIRELANTIERAVALTANDTITADDVTFEGDSSAATTGNPLEQPLEEIERTHIKRVVDAHQGNKAAAARILGINRRTLYRKLRGRD